jgi:hypothetical protein
MRRVEALQVHYTHAQSKKSKLLALSKQQMFPVAPRDMHSCLRMSYARSCNPIDKKKEKGKEAVSGRVVVIKEK